MRYVLFVGALLTLGPTAAAQESAEYGAELFQLYCATCHGTDARGDGAMAELLTTQPSDLTQLSSRNEGRFPRFEVVRRIDGRDPMLAHGGDMPIWGNVFEGEPEALATDAGQPILTTEAIAALVRYLETVQE